MQWHILKFEQLSNQQLYDLLQLRANVFVVEQNCAYSDLDGHDTHPQTEHLLCYQNDTLVAYARILPEGLTFPEKSIGRVVIPSTARGDGFGHELIKRALAHIDETQSPSCVTIGAQYHLSHFYCQYGFIEISEKYIEDGIPHIEMQRKTTEGPSLLNLQVKP